MRMLSGVSVLGLLAAGLMGCGPAAEEAPMPEAVAPYEAVVSVTGHMVPEVWASVSAQIGGAVVDVFVEVGEDVGVGSVLVRLDSSDALLAVEEAEAALATAQAQLALARQGPRDEEIAVAQAQIDAAGAAVAQAALQRDELDAGFIDAEIAAARARVAAAESERHAAWEAHEQTMKCRTFTQADGTRQQVCPALGPIEEQARQNLRAADQALAAAQSQVRALVAGSPVRHQAAEAGVQAAEAQKAVAKAQLSLLEAAPARERVAVAEAAVAQAKAVLKTAKGALTRFEVRAPFAGTVGAVLVRPGEVSAPGQALVTLGALTTLWVETTDLDEIDVARVTVGQPAAVAFDALPGRFFSCRGSRIAPMATLGTGGVNYTAVIEIDDLGPEIRWGMTAFVDIEVD